MRAPSTIRELTGRLAMALALTAPSAAAQFDEQLFEVPTHVTSSQARDGIVADFDADGSLDVALLQYAGLDQVAVLLGKGDGGFVQADALPTGTTGYSLTSADFNGDEILDLAVARPLVNSVWTFHGLGDGTFGPSANFQVGSSPIRVRAGDFDGDGDQDLVVVNSNNDFGTVRLMRGDGTGAFAFASTIPVGQLVQDLAVADFDADGIDDLAVSRYAGFVHALRGQASGTFVGLGPFAVGAQPASIAAADVNGDGVPDVLTANHDVDAVSYLCGLGDGSFAPAVSSPAGDAPTSIALDDFDGDALLDVLIANDPQFGKGGTIALLRGHGDGTFSEVSETYGSFAPEAAFAGDFDGDGKSDVVTSNWNDRSVSFLRGLGDGSFIGTAPFEVGERPEDIAVGDFDRDGVPDVALAGYIANQIEIRQGQGDGTLAPLGTVPSGFGPRAIAVADLDADGWLDLAVGNQNDDTVSIHLGGAGGGFGQDGSYPLGNQPKALTPGDVDGDARLDLLVVHEFDHTLQVLLGDGEGGFVAGSGVFDVGSMPHAVAAGDFDGDGALDAAVAHETGLLLLPGDGQGGFGNGVTIGAGTRHLSVVAGDVNDDGILDVVAGMDIEPVASVVVLLGAGDGTFSIGTVGAAPGANAVRLGDFDGDGLQDLACTSVVTDALTLARGNGDGSFDPPVSFGAGGQTFGFETADFDLDGALDVVCFDRQHSTATVLLNRRVTPWNALGHALAGTGGLPLLFGLGTLEPAGATALHLIRATPSSTVAFVIGATAAFLPFKGGTLVPAPLYIAFVPVGPSGQLVLPFHWPPGLPSGAAAVFQAWMADAAGVSGFAASNGLSATTP